MVFDITNLKKIRKQLNLTQHEFAKKAGISQSMVAKIESGRLDPTYSYVKKIEEAIEQLTKTQESEAKDIMNKKVISVNKNEEIKNIINLLTKYDISQVPVLDNDIVVGLITESILLEHKEDVNKKASEVMGESPPIVAKSAKISVITSLLRFYSIVLINEAGKLVGVITKADILKNLK